MADEITLRDEFALGAMAGDWASQLGHFDGEAEDGADGHLRERAKLYYRMADVMMTERNLNRGTLHQFKLKDDPPQP